jgi:citrate lyase beta subunit
MWFHHNMRQRTTFHRGLGHEPGTRAEPRDRGAPLVISTYLFAPALDGRKVLRAFASGAGAVVLDLEDSIADGEKGTARNCAAQYAHSRANDHSSPELWVRVNAGTEFEHDVAAIDWRAVTGVFLPKAEDPTPVQALIAAGARQVVPIIESAVGLHRLGVLAAAGEAVTRFAIGTYDLSMDLGLLSVNDPDDSELIWQLRGSLVVESRRLHLLPPIDGVSSLLDDDASLRQRVQRARMLGFAAKLLIHPNQLSPVREGLAASPEEVLRARRIVETYTVALGQGRGAVRVDGRMVDRPIYEIARALLDGVGSTL